MIDTSLRLPTREGLLAVVANRRFRWWVIGALMAILVPEYVWHQVLPWVLDQHPHITDLTIYFGGALDLHQGKDPYLPFFNEAKPDAAMNDTYIYPPLLAWLLIPALGLPFHIQNMAAELVIQLCLLGFLASLAWGLRERDPQVWAVGLLLCIEFEPWRGNTELLQVNAVLLLLTGLFFAGYVRNRAWFGGPALGLAVALKLFQAPLLALLGYRRSWKQLALALGALLVAWLVAAPGYLPEYLVRVLPKQAGTGHIENASPLGLITRTLDPQAVIGVNGTSAFGRALALMVALAVVTWSWRCLRRAHLEGEQGRALEVALVLAATPFVLTLQWYTHLALLLPALLPSLLLSFRARRWGLFGISLLAWALLGIGVGAVNDLILMGAAATVGGAYLLGLVAPAGLVVCWLASLRALVTERV